MDKNYSNDNYNLVYSDTMIITNYILRNSVRYFDLLTDSARLALEALEALEALDGTEVTEL